MYLFTGSVNDVFVSRNAAVATEVVIVVVMPWTWEITRSNWNRITGYCD